MGQPVMLPRQEQIFVAAWHFPEVATLFGFARTIHALLLVSQDAPWFKALRSAGCTLNFQAPGAIKRLVREMQAGRVVAAMLDHAIPGTQCEPARLLGRTVSTPSGILELCSRYGYRIGFVAPRPGGNRIVAEIDATGRPTRELAQQYNDWLEQEVRAAPERWLMWQALPLRQQGQAPRLPARPGRTMTTE
jgi:lauroyl/myristoyl acyltransferase